MLFISVLMTCYNRENYISESIQSVLDSSYQNFELIIVDDCSTDSSFHIANEFAKKDDRVKIFSNIVNLGDYRNRNNAVKYSNYDYFTFVDSDDLIFEHTLETMVDAIIQFPDSGVYIMTRDQDKFNKVSYSLNSKEAFKSHFFVNGFLETGPLGTVYNKSIFQQLNGFSDRRMTSDIDYFLRVTLNGPIVRLPSGLGYWRSHENQESNQGFEYYLLDMVLIYKNVFKSVKFPLKIYKPYLLVRLYLSKLKDILFFVLKTKKIKNLKYLYRLITVREFIS
jgi:glycosyltransferase involved in cell wall biosynthesis